MIPPWNWIEIGWGAEKLRQIPGGLSATKLIG